MEQNTTEIVTEEDLKLCAATLEFIWPRRDEFAREFYGQLFIISKEAYDLFTNQGVDMDRQIKLFMSTLFSTVNGARKKLIGIQDSVIALGIRHKSYGAPAEFYPLVGEVLIKTFAVFMGANWTPQKEKSWKKLYSLISSTMLEGYQ